MIFVEGQNTFVLGGQAALLDDTHEMAWAETHVTQNRGLAWMIGKFVEADRPNENGHVFALDDLPEAQKSIPNTPLNWVHRPHYIVGNYAASELVYPVAEVAADENHPYVEALAAFYRYYYPEEYVTVSKAHADGSLFYCVDDETELLSASGWKRRADLVVGEQILTLNTQTGLSEWTALDRVHAYETAGQDVIRMEGMMHSSVTTPNHRWWVERRPHRGGASQWQWRTTETLTQETWIPRAVQHADFPVTAKYDDAFVELMGWFWTEATDTGSGSVIFQSHAKNPLNCDRIAAALAHCYGAEGRVRDGGAWYRTTHGRMTHFHLCKSATAPLREVGGKIPSPMFIGSLTKSQLGLFVEVSLLGDGDNAASGQLGISQNSLEAQRSFEMACALLGIPTNTNQCANGQWRVGLVRRSNRINPVNAQRDQGFTIIREPHDGVVWCPQTVNGTFLARRRGTVYFTGNSMECVPEKVVCNGVCGQEFAYQGRTSPTYCAHLNVPGARKGLRNPHFTGGAVIVPPVKPGWKRADITELSGLLRQRALDVEPAYASVAAEAPHLAAAGWEQVMALFLRQVADLEYARDFSTGQRKDLAAKGHALPDGSYPIVTAGDLGNAIKAFGRANPADRAKVKAHIVKRAKALGRSDLLPDSWS